MIVYSNCHKYVMGQENCPYFVSLIMTLVVHYSSKWVWFNYLAVLHGLYWTERERHFNMSHCLERGVSLSSLCELHVIEPSSVILLFPRVSVCSVRVCVCVHLGSQEGGLLAGRAAQLSSLCLGQPLGQSGLSGRSSSGATSELACKRKTKETRMIWEQAELSKQDTAEQWNGQNPSLHWVLVEDWRHKIQQSQSNLNGQIYVQTIQNTDVLYWLLLQQKMEVVRDIASCFWRK